jgi:hypothetical protein
LRGEPVKARERIRERLSAETGRLSSEAPFTVALLYPSPYGAAMSSLGYQRIYRAIHEAGGLSCERFVLDDEAEGKPLEQSRPVSYESLRGLDAFPVVAASVAYEGEIAGFLAMLEAAGIPALRTERDDDHPFVLAGGPLTFSNPLPLAPFCDAIVSARRAVTSTCPRRRVVVARAACSRSRNPACSSESGAVLSRRARDDAMPRVGSIRTPHAVLRHVLHRDERGARASAPTA